MTCSDQQWSGRPSSTVVMWYPYIQTRLLPPTPSIEWGH